MEGKCPFSNKQIIDAACKLGEAFADTKLREYQKPFARRFVESVLKEDVATLTALYSRQCLYEETYITPTKKIKDLKINDLIPSVTSAPNQVTDFEKSEKECYSVNNSLIITKDHLVKTGVFKNGLLKSEWKFLDENQKDSKPLSKKDYLINQTHLLKDELDKPEFDFEAYQYNEEISEETKVHLIKCFYASQLILFRSEESFSYEKDKNLLDQIKNQLVCEVPKTLTKFLEHLGIKAYEHAANVHVVPIKFKEEVKNSLIEYGFKNSHTTMKWILKTGIVEFKRGNRKLTPRFRFTADNDLTEFFFRYHGLEIERFDSFNKRQFVIVEPESLIRLEHLLKHDSQHTKLKAFTDHYYIRVGLTISPEDFSEIALNFTRLKHWFKPSLISHYRKNGVVLANLLRTIRILGTDENQLYKILSKESFLTLERVRTIDYVGLKITVDIETTNQQFFGNQRLVHNSGKTESISIVADALTLLLPSLAKRFPTDRRFKKFSKGVWIGIFAPSRDQSRTTYDRIKTRIESETGKKILEEFDVVAEASNGDRIILSNGSIVRCHTASDKSNIESKTYHILILEESQDISPFKIRKSILPMGSDTAATVVMVGTANTQVNDLYVSCEQNKENEEKTGIRDHFEVDYNEVIKFHPRYEKYVNKMKAKIGEDSDEFKMSFLNIWCFERGMAFTKQNLSPKTYENPKGIYILGRETLSHYNGVFPCVAGLDLGKEHDSTVLTIALVDLNRPVERYMTLNYPKMVIYWLEMLGDDYSWQIPSIINAVRYFNVSTLTMDVTGPGVPVYDMLKNALDIDLIPYHFSLPSKDLLFKHLTHEVNEGMLEVPFGKEVATSTPFKKFHVQMSQAIKTYKNGFMIIRKPLQKINGSVPHDDFVESLAMMMHSARQHVQSAVEIEGEENFIFERTSQDYIGGHLTQPSYLEYIEERNDFLLE